jgi:uncharacterized membrane protein YoaK (UPF0700 family)
VIAMQGRARLGTKEVRDLLLILLAFGAGAVDAISFLGLGRVFTANMTGNIVLLGLAAGSAAGSEATRSAVSLAAFCFAVFTALWISRRPKRDRLPAGVVVALGLETATQGGFLAGWLLSSARPHGAAEAILVGVSALAMGLQSGAVIRLGVRGVSTTYVTGTLTGLISELVSFSGSTRDWARRVLVLAALLAGAACAAVLVVGVRHAAPVLPLAVTSVVFAGAILLRARVPAAT